MNAPNRVIQRDENFWAGVDRDGQIVATASRRGPRTLWHVWVRAQLPKTPTGRNQSPHVRVSGRLPEDVQTTLLYAILENV